MGWQDEFHTTDRRKAIRKALRWTLLDGLFTVGLLQLLVFQRNRTNAAGWLCLLLPLVVLTWVGTVAAWRDLRRGGSVSASRAVYEITRRR